MNASMPAPQYEPLFIQYIIPGSPLHALHAFSSAGFASHALGSVSHSPRGSSDCFVGYESKYPSLGFDLLPLTRRSMSSMGDNTSSSSGAAARSATTRPRRAEERADTGDRPTRRAIDASPDARREADARASGAPEAAAVANISRRRWDRAGAECFIRSECRGETGEVPGNRDGRHLETTFFFRTSPLRGRRKRRVYAIDDTR
jgi:hypothetical protein